jgi:hypothetical protein
MQLHGPTTWNPTIMTHPYAPKSQWIQVAPYFQRFVSPIRPGYMCDLGDGIIGTFTDIDTLVYRTLCSLIYTHIEFKPTYQKRFLWPDEVNNNG